MTETETIVKKKTPEFAETQKKYLELFFLAKSDEYLKRGEFSFGEHAGKFLGCTTQKILDAKLPKPFGCPSLFIQPCIEDEKVTGVIWFCGINGCICACCREDMTEEYPNYCPKYEVDDCTLHDGDCDACPSRAYCQPDEYDEPEDWEVDEWEGDF